MATRPWAHDVAGAWGADARGGHDDGRRPTGVIRIPGSLLRVVATDDLGIRPRHLPGCAIATRDGLDDVATSLRPPHCANDDVCAAPTAGGTPAHTAMGHDAPAVQDEGPRAAPPSIAVCAHTCRRPPPVGPSHPIGSGVYKERLPQPRHTQQRRTTAGCASARQGHPQVRRRRGPQGVARMARRPTLHRRDADVLRCL